MTYNKNDITDIRVGQFLFTFSNLKDLFLLKGQTICHTLFLAILGHKNSKRKLSKKKLRVFVVERETQVLIFFDNFDHSCSAATTTTTTTTTTSRNILV